MRKQVLFLFCISLPAFATYNGYGLQWDVRTTGSNSNSGGFDPTVASPGTDESQVPTGTTMTVTVGATTTQGISSPVFSATAHGPGNTMILSATVSGSCTSATFTELSQSAGTATFSGALGTTGSVCTFIMGGSKASLCPTSSSNTCTSGVLAVVYNSLNTVWVHSGTYTLTTTLFVASQNSGSIVNVTIAGYYSTHGDITPACLAANCVRPIITTSTNSLTLVNLNNTGGASPGLANSVTFQNLVFSNTASSAYGMISLAGPNVFFYQCKFDTTGAGTNNGNVYSSAGLTAYGTFWLCEFASMSTSNGFADCGNAGSPCGSGGATGQFYFYWCYFHGGTAGISNLGYAGNNKWYVYGCVFANLTRGIDGRLASGDNGPNVLVLQKSAFYNMTNEGVNLGSYALSFFWAQNNIFYGGTYGIYVYGYIADSSSRPFGQQFAVSNAYGNQSTAAYLPLSFGAATAGVLGGFPAGTGDVTLTANPFTNAGSGNFSLNNTAGGGASLKAAGFPGATQFGTGYPDIGVLQSQAAAGASIAAGGYVQ